MNATVISQFGPSPDNPVIPPEPKAEIKPAMNAGARVIATTTRNEARFETLKKLGAWAELEGPDLSAWLPETGEVGPVLNLVRNSVPLNSMKIPKQAERQYLAGSRSPTFLLEPSLVTLLRRVFAMQSRSEYLTLRKSARRIGSWIDRNMDDHVL